MCRSTGAADVHVHLPAGGEPKDGVSAGVTIAVAQVSALTGHPARRLAMTGEPTLSGALAPVGSIRSKLFAADHVGMAGVIVPGGNEQDVKESGGALRSGLVLK